jgi:hypothetical protein
MGPGVFAQQAGQGVEIRFWGLSHRAIQNVLGSKFWDNAAVPGVSFPAAMTAQTKKYVSIFEKTSF